MLTAALETTLQLLALAAQTDATREDELLRAAAPLIRRQVSAMRRSLPAQVTREDAEQEAAMALLTAARTFSAERGVPFCAWARMAMRRRLIDWGAEERMPGGVCMRLPREAWRALADGAGSAPVRRAGAFARAGAQEAELLADGAADPAAALERAQDAEHVRRLLRALPARQRQVLQALYGIDAIELRECELAAELNVTRDVVAGLRRRALRSLAAQAA